MKRPTVVAAVDDGRRILGLPQGKGMSLNSNSRKGCLMVRALLICCAMFGDDAIKATPADGDQAGYEAILKKTAETATAQIQLALWCEAHGMGPERDLHLQRAIKLEPGNALARSLLGMMAFKGQWTKPEQVEQATQNDPKFQAIFREYLDRRVHTPQKADAQLRLAAWCAQNGLNEEAMVHYHAVTRIDPSRDIAWIKLGYKKNKDRWVKPDDLAAQKLELELQKKADAHWKTRLEKLRDAVDSKAEARRLKAERELYEITDPRAVAMIWKTFGTGGEKSRLLAVTLFSQIDGPAASFWLAALALDKTSAAVRESAMTARLRRDPRDVIGQLIALIHRPYAYKVVAGTGPGSTGALMVDGERFDLRRLYRFPDMDVRLMPVFNYAPTDQSLPGANSAQAANSVAMNYRLNLGLAAQREAIIAEAEQETMKMNVAVDRSLENDVMKIEQANAQINQTNAQVLPLLESLTGQKLGADPVAWRKWWSEQLGYVYEDRYGSKPTLCDSVSVPDLTVYAPTIAQAHSACFAAGTLVHTIDGPRKIESISIGDRVLAQDTSKGTLSFQPVLATHLNGPSNTLWISIGDETVVATGIHRFWQAGKGWAMARDLKPGDQLRMIGGVAKVESIEPGLPDRVYNLTVAGSNDFLVGAAGLLVHDFGFVQPVSEPFDRPATLVKAAAR